MKRAYSIATCMLLLEGIAYSISAMVVFKGQLSIDALRFLGTGLGWLFLALLNLSAGSLRTRRTARLVVVANCLATLFFLALAMAKPGALAILALVVVLVCLAGSFRALRDTHTASG
jgi:hypothetical protein